MLFSPQSNSFDFQNHLYCLSVICSHGIFFVLKRTSRRNSANPVSMDTRRSAWDQPQKLRICDHAQIWKSSVSDVCKTWLRICFLLLLLRLRLKNTVLVLLLKSLNIQRQPQNVTKTEQQQYVKVVWLVKHFQLMQLRTTFKNTFKSVRSLRIDLLMKLSEPRRKERKKASRKKESSLNSSY